jgi:membrane protein DedA with SNARE-associated domain
MEDTLAHLINAYGVWIVAAVVGLESMGIPLPGEATLITAATYAGASGRLNILGVVIAAAAGATVGDNAGFWIGRELGYHWLLRHGALIHMTERRVKLGQYLFQRHGGAVVFFGRFVAVLRAFAAFLAGVNRMRWPRFLMFNAAGGFVWASLYGFGAYQFGALITRLAKPVGVACLVLAAAGVAGSVLFIRRHEEQLEDAADSELPGPLRP